MAQIDQNKNFELKVSRFIANTILDFRFDVRMTGFDHAEPSLKIARLGLGK